MNMFRKAEETGGKFDTEQKPLKARQQKKHPLPTILTLAFLLSAASLLCWPSQISKHYVLRNRRIKAVDCILCTAFIFVLLQPNNC